MYFQTQFSDSHYQDNVETQRNGHSVDAVDLFFFRYSTLC